MEEKKREPLLRAERLTLCYGRIPAVQDVTFQVREGEILGIVGESGSGKSTLIRGIAGLLGPSGRIGGGGLWYRGESLIQTSPKQRRALLGGEIGMVFQDCRATLCPVRTIGAQAYEAMRARRRIRKKEAFEKAGELMARMGLEDPKRILRSYPFQLSGGMNQRVGIAMAMMQTPGLLLADEPTSALDVTVQQQVMEELLLMRDTYHTAILLVSHNLRLMERVADTVLILKDGRVREYGEKDKVLRNPQDPYTRELFNSVIRLKRKGSE